MKKILLLISVVAFALQAQAQDNPLEGLEGQSCTSIMVGKMASADGSVITSHTCDGRYRTWMRIEPASTYAEGAKHQVLRGTMKTTSPSDTTGVKVMGEIPQVRSTYAYLNTAYPCLNEKQLAIGETTFSGPDTLVNEKGMFTIEELERVALQRCETARDAIRLIGKLVKDYGYGDGGECITIADKKEVWQMEICGEGPDKIGGVWAAQRIPDDHVGVSANIPRIGKLDRKNPDYFMCSDNCEKVAKKYGLWDGKGDFVFWKAFNSSYAQGKNFREREFFILNALAPSLHLSMDMAELPFSVKPDEAVDVRKVMELLRSTYEGTDMDMCQNVKMVTKKKLSNGTIVPDTIISPIANPWLNSNMQNTLNFIAPGTVAFRRTVSVAWCSYSFVAQMRDWLPDAIGGVVWMSVDNPGQSPRIPIFSGNTRLPVAFNTCGQKAFNERSILWQYRKANKLATIAWQRTKPIMNKEIKRLEDMGFNGLAKIEGNYIENTLVNDLNGLTFKMYDESTSAWKKMEETFWQMFGMGF